MPTLPKGTKMITAIVGGNSFILDSELSKRVNSFIGANGDLAVEHLDGEDSSFEQIQASVESVPFLSAKKLVVLRNPGTNKQFAEKFGDLVGRVHETTELIIVESKVDKRSVYYKNLKKLSDFIDCSELDARELPTWLVQFAKEEGGSLSQGDARYLVERIGANQQMLRMEVEKLLLYKSNITRETIDLLTELTPQSNVFQLLEAAFSGDTKRALRLYHEQRMQKVEPLAIIGMLAWQLHIVAVVKAAGGRSAAEIAKEAKLNPFVVQKTQVIADRITFAEVKSLIADVVELDKNLKSTNVDADDAMMQLLIGIATVYKK